MLSTIAQEYLETIYNITVEGDAVVNARLAEKFNVAPPSVTEMLHRLERDGYVIGNRPAGLRLTDQGIAAAEASLRRHRLAERFLAEVLQLDWIAAHEEAHALQNALTPTLEARIVALLGNPTTCPHGNPIPGSAPRPHDFLRSHGAVRLINAPVGTAMRVLLISEVVEDETALLRAVEATALRPGVTVLRRENLLTANGPCLVEVAGQSASVSRSIAEKIWVCSPTQAP